MKSKQDHAIEHVLNHCIQCTICVKECTFLQNNGDPKELASLFQKTTPPETAFSCSLCGLCTAVCPKEVDPTELFFSSRQLLTTTTNQIFKAHRPLRRYEKMGCSSFLSWYGLPEGCDTIFFPGCALPGTRPQRVLDVIQELTPTIANLGVLLACCTKPSHDLGDHTFFTRHFKKIQAFLTTHAITTVLVACPNCYRMFKDYAKEMSVQTIYQRLPPQTTNAHQNITVHDPCGVRFRPEIHQAVRTLLKKSNADITEMKHHGTTTLCCGEGGGVGFLEPHLAKSWTAKRAEEAQNQKVITYCAGCTHFLGQEMNASHLLDFLYEPQETMAGNEKIASSPMTYWHRFRLKSRLKKQLTPVCSGSLA